MWFKEINIQYRYIATRRIRLDTLDTKRTYKLLLPWTFELASEICERFHMPEGNRYLPEVMATVRWDTSADKWKIMDMCIVNCHAANIYMFYDIGEPIDMECHNIFVVKTLVDVVENISECLFGNMEAYKGKPKRRYANILHIPYIDDSALFLYELE